MAKPRRKVQPSQKKTSRRPRPGKPVKTHAAKSRGTRGARQQFAYSHLRDQDFDHGLRPYSAYRDLGYAEATAGQLQAHVIRMTKPFVAEDVAIPHYHDVRFQMVYVLKGWFRSEFDGHGAHTFHAGSSWIQPPKIRHTVLGYSDDCELLEIILPAKFETVMLDR